MICTFLFVVIILHFFVESNFWYSQVAFESFDALRSLNRLDEWRWGSGCSSAWYVARQRSSLGKCQYRFSSEARISFIYFVLDMMPSKKIFNIAAFPFHLLGSDTEREREIYIYLSYKYFVWRGCCFSLFDSCEKHWGRTEYSTRCLLILLLLLLSLRFLRTWNNIDEIIVHYNPFFGVQRSQTHTHTHDYKHGGGLMAKIEKLIPCIYSANMWNDSHRFHYTAKVFAGSAFIIWPGIYIII